MFDSHFYRVIDFWLEFYTSFSCLCRLFSAFEARLKLLLFISIYLNILLLFSFFLSNKFSSVDAQQTPYLFILVPYIMFSLYFSFFLLPMFFTLGICRVYFGIRFQIFYLVFIPFLLYAYQLLFLFLNK